MLTNNARCSPTRPLTAQGAIWGVLLLGLATPAVPAESFPVLIRVEAAKSQGDLKAIWLHDYAMDAVRRALPTARVGGPEVAGSGGRFMRDFLEHCLRGANYATGQVGTPLDFVAFHAKGAPTATNGHVRMGILALSGLPFADGDARLEHFRINEEHRNAFRAWQRMGSPQQPTPEQYAVLRQAGQLATLGPPETVRVENGASLLTFSLPHRGVALLVLEWGLPPAN